MTIGISGNNLVFLISQPRSGSTLLQRILGGHPEIHTMSEPWIMLPPVYSLRCQYSEAEYNARFAREAITDFWQNMPQGKQVYLEGLRKMYSYIYDRALADSEKSLFLDKTPRYYYIIPELQQIFPDARLIILFRNPLAVLCSVLKTWINENWLDFHLWEHDLLKAPNLLIEGVEYWGDRCLTMNYENLLGNADGEIKRICHYLDLDFDPNIINYQANGLGKWSKGDVKNVYDNSKPDTKHEHQWLTLLQDCQVWRIVRDYLELLGSQSIENMGYSYDELQKTVDMYRPPKYKLMTTFSLEWIFEASRESQANKTLYSRRKNIVRLMRIIQRYGLRNTKIA